MNKVYRCRSKMYAVAISCVLIFFLWYLIQLLKWRKYMFLPLEKLPGARWYPIFGTLYLFLGLSRDELFLYYENHVKSMPPLFRSWHGPVPEVNVRKPAHLEIVMNNVVHITKGHTYDYILPWLGEGLLISTGAKWHERRKLLTPTFHFKILENFMKVFVDKSKQLSQQLEKEADGHFFDIYPYITHCTLDIICETAMGVKLNSMEDNNSDYVKTIYSICEIIVWRFTKPFLRWNKIFYLVPKGRTFKEAVRKVHSFSNNVIANRRQLLRNNPGSIMDRKSRLSFLDMLLEASKHNPSLTDKDIREEVDTFMFEGHDTTTASMCWALFLLGNNLDIQNKVYAEVQEVLEDKMVPITIEELNKLKYLECVIKEALRLYPSVPVISRKSANEFYIEEYRIPKDVQLVLHIYQIHRDAEYFPDPEKFDPDRFLPENCADRHPYAYIPFSAGARNCVGQKFALYEEKTMLASIIKQFEIQSADRPEDLKICGDVILRPANGINVKLTKRNK